jgi:hypothetical protein
MLVRPSVRYLPRLLNEGFSGLLLRPSLRAPGPSTSSLVGYRRLYEQEENEEEYGKDNEYRTLASHYYRNLAGRYSR